MFTEIAARFFHMFRKANYVDETKDITIRITFPNPHFRYEFEKLIKLELKPYQIDFEGLNFQLEKFKFNGINWEFVSK